MFDDRLVTNRALLDYKNGLFGQVAILEFFQREALSIYSKIKKLLFGLLLEEIRLEIMFDNRLVTYRALLDYKNGLFGQVAILLIFPKGDPMNLEQI